MEKQKLPLREGVGIIVLNSRNKVFVGKRKDNPNNNWQMPQGGVNNGENYISAMKRELEEETSISNIKVVKELDYYLEYELPKNLVGIIWKGKFRGQKQKWFIVKFLGKDSDINIRTKNAEFIEWKWLDIEDLPKVIVYFKKHIYEKLKKELKKIIV
ncbi:MAG: RNA pyrophosphohydrolase [Pelagibacteraceae bacterium]